LQLCIPRKYLKKRRQERGKGSVYLISGAARVREKKGVSAQDEEREIPICTAGKKNLPIVKRAYHRARRGNIESVSSEKG